MNKAVVNQPRPLPLDGFTKKIVALEMLALVPYFLTLFVYNRHDEEFRILSLLSILMLLPIVWILGKRHWSDVRFKANIAIYIISIFVLGVFLGTEMSSFLYSDPYFLALILTMILVAKHEKHRRHQHEQEVFQ